MRRRFEKSNLGFSHVFSANLSYILSNIFVIGNFLYVYRTNKWFTTAENTDAKYIAKLLYNI